MKTPLISTCDEAPTSPAPDEPPEATVIVDKKMGTRFRRGKLLGKGGFAKVYEVTRLDNGAKFADKVIHKEVFQKKKSSKEKVRKEIELHKDLTHHNIVRLINYFEDSDFIHIILEYCSLKSLLHLMKSRRVLTEPEVRNFMAQICEGVRYIHGKGIIHRDLKLGNMFLTSALCVKIGDFGLATTLAGNNNSQIQTSGTTTLCGTPNYIAPEVLRKQGHSRETDVWALGCMTYAMLAGSPPFETKSLSATYARIAANEYELSENLSGEVRTFIKKMLHPEAQFRGHLHLPGHPDDLLEHPFFKAHKQRDDRLYVARQQQQQQQLHSHQVQQRVFKTVTGRPRVDVHVGNSHSHSSNLNQSIMKTTEDLLKQLQQLLATFLQPSALSVSQSQYAAALPRPAPALPVHVSKWIDYSNKYGFGYQLSDKRIGVLFNDATKISQGPDRMKQAFTDAAGQTQTFTPDTAPGPVQHHVKLLQHFAQYMDENLADNSKTASTPLLPESSVEASEVVKWFRTRACVIMVLDNFSLQINFFSDHEKVLLWAPPGCSGKGPYLSMLSGDAPLTLPISLLSSAPPPALTATYVTKKVRDCAAALTQFRMEGILREGNEQ